MAIGSEAEALGRRRGPGLLLHERAREVGAAGHHVSDRLPVIFIARAVAFEI